MKKENKEILIRLLVSALIIGVLALGVYLVFYFLGWTKLTKEELQTFIAGTGAVAPIVFIAVTFAQVTLVPIPGAVTILAGSFLFGFWKSFLYSYIGMMIGSIVSFALGRAIGRPYVNWVAGGEEKADEWIKKLKGRENVFLFFAFFLPLFPDDILCAVAGALPVKWFTFIVMQIITRATSILATMLFMSGEIIPFYGWGLIVLGAVAIVCVTAFIICIKYAEQLNAFFSNFVDKISGKSKNKVKD
ncbi:MAG: TVP38/TMEM64 family protein [Clostridia bacterium]|nr:TVP38/TMEM64 family protein [Clostridia bacterium]